MKSPHSDDPVRRFVQLRRSGYDDPRATAIAEFLHQLALEARTAAKGELRVAEGDE
jgi:hypothetical protein